MNASGQDIERAMEQFNAAIGDLARAALLTGSQIQAAFRVLADTWYRALPVFKHPTRRQLRALEVRHMYQRAGLSAGSRKAADRRG